MSLWIGLGVLAIVVIIVLVAMADSPGRSAEISRKRDLIARVAAIYSIKYLLNHGRDPSIAEEMKWMSMG